MNFQTPNFDFIATAGQQAGQMARGIREAKAVQLDDNQATQAHQNILKQVSNEYMQATGEKDPVKAIAFATKYFPGKFKSETGSQAASRWMTTEPKFIAALQELKVRRYHRENKEAAPKEVQRTEPSGQVTTQEPTTAAPAGQRPLSGFTGVAGMQEDTLSEPVARGTTNRPPQTSQERYEKAQSLGVMGDKTVGYDVQRAQDIEVGQNYAPGQTRAPFLAGQAGAGIDVTTGAAKEIGAATPTEKDIMTDQRLKLKEEQRGKLSLALRQLKDAGLNNRARDKNTLRLIDSQIKAVEEAINASEYKTKVALGIATGKDLMGQTTFETGPEAIAAYKDAEGTLSSALSTLRYIEELNKNINPVPEEQTQPKNNDPLEIR